nr:leucine-rich receptor-like protein kinase family protein [Tanacetum cinerariifolium]
MVEPEKPLKKKDQIEFDEEDDVQAIIDADHELAERLQAEEQGELTIKERSKLFVKLINEMKKHFERLRAEEKRRKPPTKTQKRNQMYSKVVKDRAEGSETRAEGSSKRAREELESNKSKKQKLNEKVEVEVDNDKKEAKMKMYMKIVFDDEVAINAIPRTTKPPIIVDWKIIKEGKISSYHIIRADESSKRYSSMIQMLQNIDREDLETLWKLVKAKYGNTWPEEAYERVLWGDLKVIFKPDIEIEVWRELQGNKEPTTIELEPETYIASLHCHKELPKGVNFVNKLVIEKPKHGLFFINAFGEEAFHRVDDAHKVETKTLITKNVSRFTSHDHLGNKVLEVFLQRGYRQVKVHEFFDCLGLRQGIEDLRELFHKEKEYQTGWKIKIGDVLDSCNQRNMGFNKSGEHKKTFIGSGIGTGLIQVLHGFEFDVELLEDHTFELAHDREQHLACKLFRYREDSNEVAFAVAAIEKIYVHESLTFNNTFASTVVGNAVTIAKAITESMHQSSNTQRVSQSRIHNKKLVYTLSKGHSTLLLEYSLSGDRDVENVIPERLDLLP